MNRIKKILEYGIYFLVFALPWQTKLILRQGELGRGPWDLGMISLYGTNILLFLLIIILALSLRIRAKAPAGISEVGLKNDKVFWVVLGGFNLAILFSIFWAPDKVLASYHYILFLLGVGFFWLIIKAEYDRVKLAMAFISGLAIQGVLASWQFLTQGTVAEKWLGLALHRAGDLGASVIETRGLDGFAERWLRAYGSFDHPNILGGVAAIALIIIVNYFINRPAVNQSEIGSRLPVIVKLLSSRLLVVLSISLIFLGLVFSFSRSAAAGFAIGLLITLVFILVKKDFSKLKNLGIIFLLLGIVGGVIFLNFSNLFITRTEVSSRLEIKSFSERKMYIDDSIEIIKNKWLTGVGIGNYTKALAAKDEHRPWYYLNPVHNVLMLVWSEIGILGLLFFVCLIVYLFFQSLKKNSGLSLSILAILVIIMMFDHYLWSLPFGIIFFWGVLGFVYKNNKNLS